MADNEGFNACHGLHPAHHELPPPPCSVRVKLDLQPPTSLSTLPQLHASIVGLSPQPRFFSVSLVLRYLSTQKWRLKAEGNSDEEAGSSLTGVGVKVNGGRGEMGRCRPRVRQFGDLGWVARGG